MSTLQDSLHGTDYRVALLSPEDTALHHTRSPKCSGSLLRGSLAITTTGLSPVSHQILQGTDEIQEVEEFEDPAEAEDWAAALRDEVAVDS